MPRIERVRDALAALGVKMQRLTHLRSGSESARRSTSATTLDGSSLKVRVLGRDAQDTQRLARRWRLLAYRDPPRSAPVGRLEQVEHEALATLMAAQAGVRVPEVVDGGLGPDGDALVVTRQPDVEPLELASADQVSDELLEDLWRAGARLHAAGISHGRLNASNVLVVDDGPMLVDLSAATLGAPQSPLDIDVAELLVACTRARRPRARTAEGGRRRLGRRRRPCAAVPAARRADAAPPRPRARARGRAEGSPRRRRRRDRQGGAGDRAAAPHPRSRTSC